MRGFSLIELILVMAIIAVLFTVSVPLAINFYNTRQLDVQESGLVQALRRAQLKAMLGEGSSSFGVDINSGRYVLFSGDSYQNRDPSLDEIFTLPGSFLVTPGEVIFNSLTGTSSYVGDINLTIGNRSETININEAGRIEY